MAPTSGSVSAITQGSHALSAKKRALAAALLSTFAVAGAACSSDDSGGGGFMGGNKLLGGGNEVLAGDECTSVEGIHNFGTFNPVETNMYLDVPFENNIIPREGLEIRDGHWDMNGLDGMGEYVDPSTLTEEQNEQLDASYAKVVEQGKATETEYSRPPYQTGTVLLYENNPSSYSYEDGDDGKIDSENLQLCVFNSSIDLVDTSQFAEKKVKE